LVASASGGGVTAVLAQVQAFSKPANSVNGQFGNTSLRLYVRNGSGSWHEQDVNTSFDGRGDLESVGGVTEKKARKDGQMVMDAQHNLYVLYSSDASLLGIDRISFAKLQSLASGNAISDRSSP
jgi:hypothetical protein